MTKPEFPFVFPDLQKFFEGFPAAGGVDAEAIMDSQRKNVEAVVAVNRALIEGYQAVVARQSELAKETIDQLARMVKEGLSGSSPEANAAKQAELARTGFEKAMSNVRELTELATKANRDAFEKINERMREGFEEYRSQTTKPRGERVAGRR